MNNQEIFDYVVAHFIKQGHRAIVTGSGVDVSHDCLYRAPNGDMCAIGCLIKVEGRVELFDQLQTAHDDSGSAEKLCERLVTLACEFNLDYSMVLGIKNWE
jgi:hypothetical protein